MSTEVLEIEKVLVDAFSKCRHVVENEFESAHMELRQLQTSNTYLIEEYSDLGDKVRLCIEKKDKNRNFY
jgi:hypothetical protein